jgi:hypothetical protein
LIRTLRDHQRRHFADHVHVGAFQRSLQDRAHAAVVGFADGGIARRLGRHVVIAAYRLQAFGRRKRGQLERAQQRLAGAAADLPGYLTALVDGDVAGARRDLDVLRETAAVGGRQIALAVHMQLTIARVHMVAVRVDHLEKALALDGDVPGVAGLLHLALCKHRAGRNHFRTRAGFAWRQPGLYLRWRDHRDVAEVCPFRLEAGRLHVGEIVRQRVDLALRGLQAGRGDVESVDHGCVLRSCRRYG